MENDELLLKKWEDVYFKQMADASLGRLFRGLIHNLNGTVQAFSMQFELFALMFSEVDTQLQDVLEVVDPTVAEKLENVRHILMKRAATLPAIDSKIHECQSLLARISTLGDLKNSDNPCYLNELVATEIDFMNGDLFFKHKIQKNLQLGEKIPPIQEPKTALHIVVHELLSNTIEALSHVENPTIWIETKKEGELLEISIKDSGEGIDDHIKDKIFDPFFTTRDDRSGLGLYITQKIIEACEGSIMVESTSGMTRFTVKIPWKPTK